MELYLSVLGVSLQVSLWRGRAEAPILEDDSSVQALVSAVDIEPEYNSIVIYDD